MRAFFKSPAGVLVGLGFAAAAPIVVPAAIAAGRPILKATIKGYLDLKESAEGSVASLRERWRRLVAEARAERAAGSASPPVATPSAPV